MGLSDWFRNLREKRRMGREIMASVKEHMKALERAAVLIDEANYAAADEVASKGDVRKALRDGYREKLEFGKLLTGLDSNLSLADAIAKAERLGGQGDFPPAMDALVLLGHATAHLSRNEFSAAGRVAGRVTDDEGRAVVTRKVAAHAIVERGNVKQAVELILGIPNDDYVDEEMRNLVMSRLFRAEFRDARDVIERVRNAESAEILREWADHVGASTGLAASENALVAAHPDDRAIALAAVAARFGEPERMIDYLAEVQPAIRDSIRITFACSLGMADRLDEAVGIANRIEDAQLRDVALGYLVTNLPMSDDKALKIMTSLGSGQATAGAVAAWNYYCVTLLHSGNSANMVSVLRSRLPDAIRGNVLDLVCRHLAIIERTGNLSTDTPAL